MCIEGNEWGHEGPHRTTKGHPELTQSSSSSYPSSSSSALPLWRRIEEWVGQVSKGHLGYHDHNHNNHLDHHHNYHYEGGMNRPSRGHPGYHDLRPKPLDRPRLRDGAKCCTTTTIQSISNGTHCTSSIEIWRDLMWIFQAVCVLT